MSLWANIEVVPHDTEIKMIDRFEEKLGHLPDHIYQIRDLITRFEICHFKLINHISNIKKSLETLKPSIIPQIIGLHHIRISKESYRKDTTGRSLTGQQYIWSVHNWLSIDRDSEHPENYDTQLANNVSLWLGTINVEKARLIRLLLARLKWDWQAMEKLQQGSVYDKLEQQIIRIDICHYDFPNNLDKLLQAIGRMHPAEDFEGCGICNDKIIKIIEKELVQLHKLLISLQNKNGRDNQIRTWLLASFIKTLKEQTKLTEPKIDLSY